MKKKYEIAKKSIAAGRKRDLESYKRSGVVKAIEILCASNACKVCKKWNHKVIPLKKALKKLPLPIKGCCNEKYGYCRCTYLAVVK